MQQQPPPQGYPPQQPFRPPQGGPPSGGAPPPQGYPPQGYPPQGYPPQGYPPQGYPPQGYPPQGFRGGPPPSYPPQGYPPQGYPPQGPPSGGYPPQGYPPQGYPPQGYPPQGYPPQGYPPQGYQGGSFQQTTQVTMTFQSWGLPPEQEKEPMLLLDTTGSMNYGVSATDSTPRKDVIREAISIIVTTLGKEDSQAKHEASGGGLRTVTFAGGQAHDIDDLNPRNLRDKWAKIKWAGGTRIMPGWTKLWETYMEEFGPRHPSKRPLLMALIITDGDADDHEKFSDALKRIGEGVYVTLAVIGYGDEHDQAVRTYQKIQDSNAHVKVITFGSETNPETIARALLKMIE